MRDVVDELISNAKWFAKNLHELILAFDSPSNEFKKAIL